MGAGLFLGIIATSGGILHFLGCTVGEIPQNRLKNYFFSDLAETWWGGAFLHRKKIGNLKFLILRFFDPQNGRTVGEIPQNRLKNYFFSDLAETWWGGAFLHRKKIGNLKFLILRFFDPQNGRTVGEIPQNRLKN